MIAEPEFDGMMARTRNRPLVRKALTPTQAKTFGITTGIAGVTILSAGVNPIVALLGAGNIFLYAAVYTPLKRRTIVNTWVGAVVGGIPPLMGWAACSPDGSLISHPGGLLLGALLYAWQFPHFNALAYTMRHDYARAGYQMMSVTNPALNTRVALRYSIACLPICWGLVACGLCDPWYLLDSTLVNAWVCYKAWQFWREGGDKGTARGLFFACLVQLPAILVLAMLHKEGLWDWLWEENTEEHSVLETEPDGAAM
jgi:protoheme IX farnesyltransferase